MVENKFSPGTVVKHFKYETLNEEDKAAKKYMYLIIGEAEHTENGEHLVVYQALYEPFGVYARPSEMFYSDVDKEKYPNIKQKERFAYFGVASNVVMSGVDNES